MVWPSVLCLGGKGRGKRGQEPFLSARDVYYRYGTADGIDDRLNRVADIASTAGGAVKYADYDYLGASTVVRAVRPTTTNHEFTRIKSGGANGDKGVRRG